MALCKSCVNRGFGGTYRLHLQGTKIFERGTSVSRWLQTAHAYVFVMDFVYVHSSPWWYWCGLSAVVLSELFVDGVSVLHDGV
jgi:hypothetical protein